MKYYYLVAGRKFKSKKEAEQFAEVNDFKVVWRHEQDKWVSDNGLVHAQLNDLQPSDSDPNKRKAKAQ